MEIWDYLPDHVQRQLKTLPTEILAEVEEVRLRADRPAVAYGPFGWRQCSDRPLTAEELAAVALAMAQHSWYAREEELRQGFLTLPGGHRVGLAGTAVVERGMVVTVRDISGLNLRTARARPGVAQSFLTRYGIRRPCSVLVVSPPRGGKTTFVRDLARLWSERGVPTTVIDERGELAGTVGGRPSFDLGLHTDVLDGWPKPEGILVAVRSLAPQLVVVDELGGEGDFEAVALARRSGVAVVATLHLGGIHHHLAWSPQVERLWEAGLFEVLVRLDGSLPGDRVAEVRFWTPEEAGARAWSGG